MLSEYSRLKKVILGYNGDGDESNAEVDALVKTLSEWTQLVKGELESKFLRHLEEDIGTILPGLLLMASSMQPNLAKAALPSLKALAHIATAKSKCPSTSKKPIWWIALETKTVPKFCERLLKMLEVQDCGWAEPWCFAISLMCSENYISGPSINELLKVIEKAFKIGKRKDWTLPRVFDCWRYLVDTFFSQGRASLHTKKVYGLIVTPLLSPMPPSSAVHKLKTWRHIVDKITSHSQLSIESVVTPLIDNMYPKKDQVQDKEVSDGGDAPAKKKSVSGGEGLSSSLPNECCDLLAALASSSSVFSSPVGHRIVMLLTESLVPGVSDTTYHQFWTSVLEQLKAKKWEGNETCQLIATLSRTFSIPERSELGLQLLDEAIRSGLFRFSVISTLLATGPSSEKIIDRVFVDLLSIGEFRREALEPLLAEIQQASTRDTLKLYCDYPQSLRLKIQAPKHVLREQEAGDDRNCGKALLVWNTVVHAFTSWSSRYHKGTDNRSPSKNSPERQTIDLTGDAVTTPKIELSPPIESLVLAMLKFPIKLSYQKWSTKVHRKWFSVVDGWWLSFGCGRGLPLLSQLLDQEVIPGLDLESVQPAVAVEACSHIFGVDDTCLKSVLDVVELVAKKPPPKDAKLVMDLLLIVETAIAVIARGGGLTPVKAKHQIAPILAELFKFSTCFEQPHEHRIWTRVTKLQRKLMAIRKEEVNRNFEEKSSAKVRTPLITQSNFLHRLGKAEKMKHALKHSDLAVMFGNAEAASPPPPVGRTAMNGVHVTSPEHEGHAEGAGLKVEVDNEVDAVEKQRKHYEAPSMNGECNNLDKKDGSGSSTQSEQEVHSDETESITSGSTGSSMSPPKLPEPSVTPTPNATIEAGGKSLPATQGSLQQAEEKKLPVKNDPSSQFTTEDQTSMKAPIKNKDEVIRNSENSEVTNKMEIGEESVVPETTPGRSTEVHAEPPKSGEVSEIPSSKMSENSQVKSGQELMNANGNEVDGGGKVSSGTSPSQSPAKKLEAVEKTDNSLSAEVPSSPRKGPAEEVIKTSDVLPTLKSTTISTRSNQRKSEVNLETAGSKTQSSPKITRSSQRKMELEGRLDKACPGDTEITKEKVSKGAKNSVTPVVTRSSQRKSESSDDSPQGVSEAPKKTPRTYPAQTRTSLRKSDAGDSSESSITSSTPIIPKGPKSSAPTTRRSRSKETSSNESSDNSLETVIKTPTSGSKSEVTVAKRRGPKSKTALATQNSDKECEDTKGSTNTSLVSAKEAEGKSVEGQKIRSPSKKAESAITECKKGDRNKVSKGELSDSKRSSSGGESTKDHSPKKDSTPSGQALDSGDMLSWGVVPDSSPKRCYQSDDEMIANIATKVVRIVIESSCIGAAIKSAAAEPPHPHQLKTEQLAKALVKPATSPSPTGKKKVPTLFDESSEDFVMVPPKPKIGPTLLTEHQKEVMREKRMSAAIPALYQDLSQQESQTFESSDSSHATAFVRHEFNQDDEDSTKLFDAKKPEDNDSDVGDKSEAREAGEKNDSIVAVRRSERNSTSKYHHPGRKATKQDTAKATNDDSPAGNIVGNAGADAGKVIVEVENNLNESNRSQEAEESMIEPPVRKRGRPRKVEIMLRDQKKSPVRTEISKRSGRRRREDDSLVHKKTSEEIKKGEQKEGSESKTKGNTEKITGVKKSEAKKMSEHPENSNYVANTSTTDPSKENIEPAAVEPISEVTKDNTEANVIENSDAKQEEVKSTRETDKKSNVDTVEDQKVGGKSIEVEEAMSENSEKKIEKVEVKSPEKAPDKELGELNERDEVKKEETKMLLKVDASDKEEQNGTAVAKPEKTDVEPCDVESKDCEKKAEELEGKEVKEPKGKDELLRKRVEDWLNEGEPSCSPGTLEDLQPKEDVSHLSGQRALKRKLNSTSHEDAKKKCTEGIAVDIKPLAKKCPPANLDQWLVRANKSPSTEGRLPVTNAQSVEETFGGEASAALPNDSDEIIDSSQEGTSLSVSTSSMMVNWSPSTSTPLCPKYQVSPRIGGDDENSSPVSSLEGSPRCMLANRRKGTPNRLKALTLSPRSPMSGGGRRSAKMIRLAATLLPRPAGRYINEDFDCGPASESTPKVCGSVVSVGIRLRNSTPRLKRARPRKLFPSANSLQTSWPSGECEDWVACVPTPPSVTPTSGILKRRSDLESSETSKAEIKPAVDTRIVLAESTEQHSTPSTPSPPSKRKRVSFLDPPVSKGLLYNTDGSIGQIQHANFSPSKRRCSPFVRQLEESGRDVVTPDRKSAAEEERVPSPHLKAEGDDLQEAEDTRSREHSRNGFRSFKYSGVVVENVKEASHSSGPARGIDESGNSSRLPIGDEEESAIREDPCSKSDADDSAVCRREATGNAEERMSETERSAEPTILLEVSGDIVMKVEPADVVEDEDGEEVMEEDIREISMSGNPRRVTTVIDDDLEMTDVEMDPRTVEDIIMGTPPTISIVDGDGDCGGRDEQQEETESAMFNNVQWLDGATLMVASDAKTEIPEVQSHDAEVQAELEESMTTESVNDPKFIERLAGLVNLEFVSRLCAVMAARTSDK